MNTIKNLFLTVFAVVSFAWIAADVSAGYPEAAIRSDWTAKWIWISAEGMEPNVHVNFRRSFTLSEVPTGPVEVMVSAATHYTLYVNGHRAGFGPPISDRRYHYYETRDIGPYLKKGPNVITAHVYSLATATEDFHGGRGLFLLEGSIPQATEPVVLDTNQEWKCQVSPVWSSDAPRQSVQLHFVEIADLRQEPIGWKTVEFDDSAWSAAVEIGLPPQGGYENLVKRDLGEIDEEFQTPAKVCAVGETLSAMNADGQIAQSLAGAQWIWFPESTPQTAVAPYVWRYLRHKFTIPGDRKIVRAHMLAHADTECMVFINGQRAGVNKDTHLSTAMNIGPLLQSGPNVVAIAARNWRPGVASAGFIGKLQIEFSDGEVRSIGTDQTWKTSDQEQNQWQSVAFDDHDWVAARQFGPMDTAPWNTLPVPKTIMPALEVQAEGLFPAETVKIENIDSLLTDDATATVTVPESDRAAVIVLDMGRMVMGCPYFEVDGAAGTVIDVSISETLSDGRVLAKRRITPGAWTFLTDRITLRDGPQRWQRYDYSGYRYLQLTIRGATSLVTIRRVGTMSRKYRFTGEATFTCSDELLTKIFDAAKWTHVVNTHWGYCGSAWREHAQWSELPWAVSTVAVFNDLPQLRYYLHQTTLSQNADGQLRFPYPGHQNSELPEQTMWIADDLWKTWLYGKDKQLLHDLLPEMVKANDWFKRHLTSSGLMTTEDWAMWLVIDWGYPFVNNPEPGELATLNLTYYNYLRNVERIAQVLEEKQVYETFKAQADTLAEVINATYFSVEESRYYEKPGHESPSHYAATLAVQYDVVPEEHRERVFAFAIGDDLRPGKSCPWFMYNALEAFAAAGRHQDAVAAMKRYWGTFIKADSTVFWELWNIPGEDVHPIPGYTKEMGAATITYAIGPAPYVVNHVLGVQPLEPGFTATLIAPHYSGLEQAEGKAPTPLGYVEVQWKVDDQAGKTDLQVVVPEGMRATIRAPYSEKQPSVTLDGQLLYDGKTFQNLEGISNARKVDGALEFQAPAGAYRLTSSTLTQ